METAAFAEIEADSDGDGIPDSWERKHSGTSTGLVATADNDGDGFNNLNEWIANTDPTNNASFFKTETFTFTTATGATIGWNSQSNRAYSIDFSTNLVTSTFSNLASGVLATYPLNTYTDATHKAVVCGAYKLRAMWTGSFGTCIGCHSITQGPNRAVVLDFTNLSHHVAVTVTNNDCKACHSLGIHQAGSTILHNADTPSTLYILTGNPLTSSTEAAKLTPFCLACHDANGAGGSAPFSDGQMPAVRNGSDWASSAHATNALHPLSCYGDGTTFGCHATTHGSSKASMLAPHDMAATAPNYSAQEEGFCLNCHNGSVAVKDVSADFSKGTRHPIVNSEQAAGRSVECTDCHSTHAARAGASVYTTTATAARNQLGGPSLGLVGWSVDYSTLGNFEAPSAGNYSVVTNATYQYQICFKCHSAKSWSFGTPPNGLSANGTNTTPIETDIAQAFSPMNRAGHPVITGLSNYPNAFTPKGLPASVMQPPWNVNVGTQTMDCNDCHNTDSLSPAAQGPHGSAQAFMLRTVFSNNVATTATNWPNVTLSNFATSFCANCHLKGTHAGHANGNHANRQCYQCHIVIPHGGKVSRLMADHNTMPARYAYNNVTNITYMVSFTKTAGTYTTASCQAGCSGNHSAAATENW
ncbi:MAG: hypothetical protein C0404_01395 [Verrucomicrobia bacterium]|nr:hypothetical protein [Verrucomicrobiota bacterium]